MDLVNKQDDVLGLGDLVEHALDAFLELAAELGAGHQRGHVERDDAHCPQRGRHIPVDDALCQALDDCRLAHAYGTQCRMSSRYKSTPGTREMRSVQQAVARALLFYKKGIRVSYDKATCHDQLASSHTSSAAGIPGSPMSTGLFLVRRHRMRTTRRICSKRAIRVNVVETYARRTFLAHLNLRLVLATPENVRLLLKVGHGVTALHLHPSVGIEPSHRVTACSHCRCQYRESGQGKLMRQVLCAQPCLVPEMLHMFSEVALRLPETSSLPVTSSSSNSTPEYHWGIGSTPPHHGQ